jgi:hypothetical protein
MPNGSVHSRPSSASVSFARVTTDRVTARCPHIEAASFGPGETANAGGRSQGACGHLRGEASPRGCGENASVGSRAWSAEIANVVLVVAEQMIRAGAVWWCKSAMTGL